MGELIQALPDPLRLVASFYPSIGTYLVQRLYSVVSAGPLIVTRLSLGPDSPGGHEAPHRQPPYAAATYLPYRLVPSQSLLDDKPLSHPSQPHIHALIASLYSRTDTAS